MITFQARIATILNEEYIAIPFSGGNGFVQCVLIGGSREGAHQFTVGEFGNLPVKIFREQESPHPE